MARLFKCGYVNLARRNLHKSAAEKKSLQAVQLLDIPHRPLCGVWTQSIDLQGGPDQNWHHKPILHALTLPNINRFSKFYLFFCLC